MWNAAELITIWARGNKRGIHPAAHVALHLLIWLGCAAVSGVLATLVSLDSGYQTSYDTYYGNSDYYSQYLAAVGLEEALLALVLILLYAPTPCLLVELH